MRIVLQRVARAAVRVDGAEIARIGRGLLLFVGVEVGDGPDAVRAAARKVRYLRIFEDDRGRMNLDCVQAGGEILAVSQFTLLAGLEKGRRPGFERAMKPPDSERLYDEFCRVLAEETGTPVRTGRFGAHMEVELVNDGPATFVLEVPAGQASSPTRLDRE
jgi:D-tyrosyl-tRNA(Tyr) deacylase